MGNEQLEVSERFRRSLLTRIRKLQNDAAADEQMIARLPNEDHRRRQKILVQAQLEHAFRLSDLLSTTPGRTRENEPVLNLQPRTVEGA